METEQNKGDDKETKSLRKVHESLFLKVSPYLKISKLDLQMLLQEEEASLFGETTEMEPLIFSASETRINN